MKNNLEGLKISVCQMKVIPGKPNLNAEYIIGEIRKAKKRDIDIIVFPEMCISGYVIGDMFEDDSFVMDVVKHNSQIVKEAAHLGITVIFGSLQCGASSQKGEDGRLRKFNSAIIVNDGKASMITKTLQPNYRIFDDDRHFFSTRKRKDEETQFSDSETIISSEEFIEPRSIQTKNGLVLIGVILCEDMWHDDYPWNPTKILVDQGADIVFNLSASPWSWQKNRKRHQVVKDLLSESPVPFVYVNNTGIQNNAKNIVTFDGSSTIYNRQGNIVFVVDPYKSGTKDFSYSEDAISLNEEKTDDTIELFNALSCAVGEFLLTLPPAMRKIVIGLSGGIDSAVDATLLAYLAGKENVIAINMPSEYNSEETKSIAKQIAENLGIQYEVRPIQKIVDEICRTTGTKKDSLSYENVQARVRMEVLAARAQDVGGLFCANGNKVEFAFGYGTMYGDIAGFMAPLGDLLKREVYQIGKYLNDLMGKEMIPESCFKIKPSAELKNAQVDPFDYGDLNENGYHDEMVRAFVEFRKNPEWFLENYINKTLEKELRLRNGKLIELFKTPLDFVKDLERCWLLYCRAVMKRHPAPTIPIMSKRSFGFDLRESMLSAYFTMRYNDLKKLILSKSVDKKRIAVFGGSFNPPCKHHEAIVETLVNTFDLVIVVPCGTSRPDKQSVKEATNEDRSEMARLAFDSIPKVRLDLYDMENDTYTPTYLLQERYEKEFPEAEIWHVVGGDIVVHGGANESEIHRVWKHGKDIWNELNFAVIHRPGYELKTGDMPPFSTQIEIPEIYGSGTMVRQCLKHGKAINELVIPEIETYIRDHNLYLETEGKENSNV